MGFLKILLLFLPAIIFTFVVFPITVLIFIPFLLWRNFVTKLAPILRPDLDKMVTAEGQFLGGEDLYAENVLSSVVILEVENPALELQTLKEDIQKNALEALCPKTGTILYPELQQTIESWMGYLFWIPVIKFNIDNHISILEYPQGFDIQQELLRITRKKYWTRGRPLWEFILINNAHLPGKIQPVSLIYFRMHHIIGDGFCILQLLTRIFGDAEAANKVAKPKPKRKSTFRIVKLLQKMIFYMKMPFDFVDFLWMQRSIWRMPQRMIVKDTTRDLHLIGAMTEDIPLSELKKVKNQLGVNFTSLILSLIAGGTREMLLKTFGKDGIPKEAAIGFPMPLKNRPEKLRNHITYGVVNLPVGISDPLRRIQMISKSLRKMQTSSIPLIVEKIFRIYGCMPQPLIRLTKTKPSPLSFCMTNLLGPADPLFIHNSPILGLQVGSNCPIDGPSGWAFMFISYNGKCRLTTGGLSSQLQTVQEAQNLAELCMDQLHILSKAGFKNEIV